MAKNIELIASIIAQAAEVKAQLEENPVLAGAAWVHSELTELDDQLDALLTSCEEELDEEG